MSWLQGTNIANLAKNAMKEAQKTIDTALDIQEKSEITLDNSAWGSFTGSFFEAKDYFKSSSSSVENSEVVSTEPKSKNTLNPPPVTTVQPLSSASLLQPEAQAEPNDEDETISTDSTLRGSCQSFSTNVTDTLIPSTAPHKNESQPSDSGKERDNDGFEECDLNESNHEEEHNESKSTYRGSSPHELEDTGFHDQGSIMTPCGPELLIHEAMNDQSEAGSSSSKSYEVVKAINSGHTSGDEMETHTSSSDIEIISSPPPSIASSVSSNPRCSSPNHKKEKHFIIRQGHTRTGSELSISGSDETSQTEIDRLLKKLKDMSEILDARESKIVELSRLNIEFQEKNTDLSSQVKEAMKINNKLSENTLAAEEFTARLSNMEKKLQQTQTERDSLKDELKMIKQGSADRRSEQEWKEMMEEKDEIIADLRSEGESLSREVGKYSEHIKKLRAKDKAYEKEVKNLKSELEGKSKECDRLKKSLKAKDEIETKQIEAIQTLTSANNKLEKENNKLKHSADEATEKSENLRTSLENSYREIAELKKHASEKEDEAQEMALSKEMAAKLALQEQLRDLQEKSISERESLYIRMDDLRSSLSQAERGASYREEQLRRERDDLQLRLEESENRLQELSSTVSAATLPLQRQIESLQASLRETQSSGEKVESTLNERLQHMTMQLGAAQERDRSVSEQYMNLSSKHSSLEVKYQELLKKRDAEDTEIDSLKHRLKTVEESKKKELSSVLVKNSSISQELSEAKKEMELHQIVYQDEKAKMEAKLKHLEGQYQSKEFKIKELQQLLDKNNYERHSCRSSPSQLSSVSEQWGEDCFDNNRFRGSINNNSFYESVRVGGSSLASLVENYQFSLKQRDGEVAQLQGEVSSLERIRDSMTTELSNLSIKAEKLNDVEKEVENLNRLYKETEEKYQTMLTMYGEKVEETEELKLDLQDVKEMYKIQIQELLQSQRNG